MSKNFFAALDDSDDEGDATPKVAPSKKSESSNKKKPTVAPVVEPSKQSRERRSANNDRNTKSGRGGRVAPRDGKRAYDRRSGTGRGKETKKDGGGSRNWGSDKNEAKKNEGAVVEGEEGKKNAEPVEKEAEVKAEAEPAVVVEEEPKVEDKTVSYNDYLAQKIKPDNEAFSKKEARAFDNEFASVKITEAVEEDFLVMGEAKTKRVREQKGKKTFAGVGFKVADSAESAANKSDRGDRGDRGDRPDGRGGGRRDGVRRDGRGGGRGGRGGSREGAGSGRREGAGAGRGSGRGSGRGPKELNAMDSSAFPSL